MFCIKILTFNLLDSRRDLINFGVLIQALDARAAMSGIFPDEWMLRYDLEDQLSTIYTDEEAY